MPRPHPTHWTVGRILGLLAVAASAAVLSGSAAFAQPSPYAYDDPSEDFSFDTPFVDVEATNVNQGTTNVDPGVTSSQKPVVNTPDPAPAAPVDEVVPVVQDVTPELSVDPVAHLPVNASPLPKTGGEILERICFAMLLVAAGLLAMEASQRRRVWAR